MKKTIAFACLGIVLLATSIFGQRQTADAPKRTPAPVSQTETLPQQINRIALRYGLDARLFQALIYTESVYKIKAVSYKGAACYTQLMPATARRFGLRVDSQVDERFNSEKCLAAGAYYLAWLLRTFRGDVRLALAGYNAGEGAVMKYGWRVPPYKETVQYVEKICALYYGQSGHGVTMAYNQPQAVSWVSNLYNRRSSSAMKTAYARHSEAPLPAQNADDSTASPIPSSNEKTAVKPVVTRVAIDETPTRIRTQSLSFGNNNNNE